MTKFKLALRRLLGVCYICGKRKEKHQACIHCLFSKDMCHSCGKYWGHAHNYGMGRERILRVLEND